MMDLDNDKYIVGEAPESLTEHVESRERVGNLYGTVVPGEAPESDEDEQSEDVSTASKKDEEVYRQEVDEDDCDDGNDSCGSASEAFMYRTSATAVPVSDTDTPVSTSSGLKYNTLLHRKLCESNLSLQQGVSDLLNRPLINAVQKLNIVNQHLLTSQVEIQDAVSAMQRSFAALSKIDNTLSAVLSMPYLPKINIAIPPKNNTR